jgi:hypothetical protein
MKKLQRWCELSLVGRCVLAVVVFQMTLFPCLPSLTMVATADEGNVTMGAKVGEDQTHEFIDILVPVYRPSERGLLFVNPRFSLSQLDTESADGDEEELSFGLGYRQMLGLDGYDVILGANAYYDYRWSVYDNTFDQWGFGVEMLSEWVDARANWYFPDDEEEVIASYDVPVVTWADITPTGHRLWQERVTTHHVWEQYEAALEGYDVEVGVKLPYVDRFVETRVYVGYQSFENPFGDDFDGMKGRLELRVFPGLTIDAEYFDEEDLNETDYFVGLRAHLPFDIENMFRGENPFAGTVDRFKRQDTTVSDRMTEMVMRDPKVNTTTSGDFVEGRVFDRSQDVLLTDSAVFVDAERAGAEMDGTYENPYDEIQRGVNRAYGDNIVVVGDTEGPYNENVVVNDNVQLSGRFTGNGEVQLGDRPTVLGDGNGPTFTMGENTMVAGFVIMNQDVGGAAVNITGPATGNTYDVSRAGIASENKSNLVISDNVFDNVTYGAVLADTLTSANDAFIADIANNEFNECEEDGLVIDTIGASGTFDVSVTGSEFSRNDGYGLYVDARTYDYASLCIDDVTADQNSDSGIFVNMEDNEEAVSLTMTNITANLNEGNAGVYLDEIHAYGDATTTIDGLTAINNEGYGMYAYKAAYAEDGDAFFSLSNVEANLNDEGGIQATYAAWAGDVGNATATFTNITASYNYYKGLYSYFGAYAENGGDASLTLSNVTTNNNGSQGVYFYEGGAYAGYGSATAALDNITTNFNGYDGLYFYYDVAHAGDGDAVVTMDNITADYNNEVGIYIGDTGAYSRMGGDAFFTMTNVQANNNYYQGVYFEYGAAYASYGSATAVLDHITTNFNYYDGLYFAGYGAYGYGWDANVSFTMTNVEAIHNDESGIWFYYGMAYAHYGTATAVADTITANYNGYEGFYADYGAYSGGNGDASFSMTNVTANNNGESGIFLYYHGAYAANGNATAVFDTVTANFNGYYGIYNDYAFAATYDGDATATFNNVTASYNQDGGIWAYYYGAYSDDAGNATLTMTNVVANYNGESGIYFEYGPAAYAYDGDATVVIDNLTVSYNGEYGIYFAEEGAYVADNGDASFTMRNVVADRNTSRGVSFDYQAAFSYEGDATAVFENISASYNNGYGIYFADSYGAYSYEGDAYFSMTNVTATHNLYSGIDIYDTVAYASDGNATAVFDTVTASFNGEYGIYIGGYGAYSYDYGDASFTMTNINASNNRDGSGIHIYNSGAYSADRNATATFSNITASGNYGHGIYVGEYGAYSYYGNTMFTMSNVTADYNSRSGVYIYERGTYSIYGDATTMLDGVTANNNGEYGIAFMSYGAYAAADSGPGDAYFSMTNVSTVNNGESGIFFYYAGADTDGGTATAIFDNITSSFNGGYGMYFGTYGAYNEGSYGGDGSLTLTNVDASRNANDGIQFTYRAAYSADGDAIAMVDNVTADYNGSYGIYMYTGAMSSAGGDALFNMSNVSASHNGEGGIYFSTYAAYSEDGGASATFTNVTASHNVDHGLYNAGTFANGTSTADNAFTLIDGSDFSFNGGDGLFIQTFSGSGDAAVWMQNSVIKWNGDCGVVIDATGAAYDLKLGRGDRMGNNAILRNNQNNSGSFNLNNVGSGTVDAEKIWWGADPPDASMINGSVAYSPWLTTDPF